MAKRVTLEGLPAAIHEILAEYGNETITAVQDATKAVAEAGAKAVNSQAGVFGGSGKYKKSWTSKVTNTRFGAEASIYSEVPGLPHLLEKGHALMGGGRAPGKVHIKPVEDEINRNYEHEIEVKL